MSRSLPRATPETDRSPRATVPSGLRGGCLLRIRSYLPSLNRAQSQLAQYMLSNAELVLSQSITQLSQNATVSPATVSRFSRLLGFDDFQTMKAALRVDLLSPESNSYPRITESDSPEQVAAKVFSIAKLGINETLAILDKSELRRAAEVMATARKVEFYGVGGSSGPIATFAAHKFMNLGIITSAQLDSVLQLRSAGTLGQHDVAFGISHSGIARTVIAALRTAREQGATTVCLTNYAGAPITVVSDIVLLTAIEREAPLFGEAIASRVPQICVLDCLYAWMSLLAYRRSAPDQRR